MTSLSTFHAIIWQSNRRAVSALIGRKFAAPSRFLGCTFRGRSFVNRSQQYLHHSSRISTPARPSYLPLQPHLPHTLELQRSTHPAPARSIAPTIHTHTHTHTHTYCYNELVAFLRRRHRCQSTASSTVPNAIASTTTATTITSHPLRPRAAITTLTSRYRAPRSRLLRRPPAPRASGLLY
jgi:hypothetical protein